jgi:hypothetical protein
MSNEIEKALALVDELQTKRAQHVAKAEKLAAERDEIALSAFTGNDKHRKRVDEIHTMLAKHSSELAALDSALKSAHVRVADLRAAEEQAAATARAEEIRKVVAELGECFPYVDKHLAAAAKGLLAIEGGFKQLREHGIRYPDDTHVSLDIVNCINTWGMQLPRNWHSRLRDGMQFLQPHARKTFAAYFKAIEASLLRQATGEASPPSGGTAGAQGRS